MRLLVLWALLVYGAAVHAFAGGLLPRPPTLSVEPCRIDANGAAVGELAALPGIGPVRAEQIVLDRIRRGPFRDLADLGRVDGLGPGVLAKIGPHLRF